MTRRPLGCSVASGPQWTPGEPLGRALSSRSALHITWSLTRRRADRWTDFAAATTCATRCWSASARRGAPGPRGRSGSHVGAMVTCDFFYIVATTAQVGVSEHLRLLGMVQVLREPST